jgi:hypothetical protein
MKYIKFTYVDSVTQISVAKEPAKHGPHFPKIKGLNYLFALERKYPTTVPEFIGECDDDAELIDGFLKVLDEAEVAQEQQAEVDSQAHRVRVDRTLRLQASDWTQGKDIADEVSTAWATYRQALRDVPSQEGFPWGVIWPEQPE